MRNLTLAFLLSSLALPGSAATRRAPRRPAHVTKASAEKAALAAVPGGRILEAEHEHEKGHDIWSFDVKAKDGLREVWVDYHTGAVIADTLESKAEQAKEKAQDAKERAARARARHAKREAAHAHP